MRRAHFDALRPVCPRCRAHGVGDRALRVAWVAVERDGDILEGILHCPEASCQLEFPIVDGIPVLVADVPGFVSTNLLHLLARRDLSGVTESLLGDCAGPGSALDVARQHLSIYAWDAYAAFDPSEPPTREGPEPGASVQCLDRGFSELGRPVSGPILDVGCAVGRTTFEQAENAGDLVLGIDLSVPMLRLASRVLREGRVRYPRRRVGIVHDQREFAVHFRNADRVDFWACDVLTPPFANETFGHVTALNVIDCVSSPAGFLMSLAALLRAGGTALLSTPYDWSAAATPPAAWIGGHSQRGPAAGASEVLLDALLAGGSHPSAVQTLRKIAWLEHVPWHARMHDRSTVSYDVHLLGLERIEP